MHQQDLYGFVKHSQLRERKTDPKSQIIISRSFVLTFVDIGFLKQIGNNEVQIINILEVKSYLFTGGPVKFVCHLTSLHCTRRMGASGSCACASSRSLSASSSSAFQTGPSTTSKHGSFGDAAAVTYDDVCQIMSNALQMKSKLQYVSMFADKLVSLEEKLCRLAAR